LKSNISESEDEKISKLVTSGITESDSRILVNSMIKYDTYQKLADRDIEPSFLAKVVIHNYFGFELAKDDLAKAEEYQKLIKLLADDKISKNNFAEACKKIHQGVSYNIILSDLESTKESCKGIGKIIDQILSLNAKEVERYRAGEKQLLGFFIGQVMQASGGKADAKEVGKILSDRLKH